MKDPLRGDSAFAIMQADILAELKGVAVTRIDALRDLTDRKYTADQIHAAVRNLVDSGQLINSPRGIYRPDAPPAHFAPPEVPAGTPATAAKPAKRKTPPPSGRQMSTSNRQLLAHLADHPNGTNASIAEALNIDARRLSVRLCEQVNLGRLARHETSPRTYTITQLGRDVLAIRPPAPKAPVATPRKASNNTARPATPAQPPPTDRHQQLMQQIEQMAQSLKPPAVDDLPLKAAVLTKLADITAPDIAEVLHQVRADLQRTAGAIR